MYRQKRQYDVRGSDSRQPEQHTYHLASVIVISNEHGPTFTHERFTTLYLSASPFAFSSTYTRYVWSRRSNRYIMCFISYSSDDRHGKDRRTDDRSYIEYLKFIFNQWWMGGRKNLRSECLFDILIFFYKC